MLCPLFLDTCAQNHVSHFGTMTSAHQIQDASTFGNVHKRGTRHTWHITSSEKPLSAEKHIVICMRTMRKLQSDQNVTVYSVLVYYDNMQHYTAHTAVELITDLHFEYLPYSSYSSAPHGVIIMCLYPSEEH